MMQVLHARDPSSLLPGSLRTCSYLRHTSHRHPAHKSITWKEQQDEQQWEKQDHNLRWSVVILQRKGLRLWQRQNSCSILRSWSLPIISKGHYSATRISGLI